MHRYVLVFAENIAEANTYAKRAGLPRGRYRAVGHAASIRRIQVADVHELPSFERRRDKHAIRAEIRHGRDIRYFKVEMPPKPEEPAVDQGDGMGQQLTIEQILAEQAKFAESHVIATPEGLEPVSNVLESEDDVQPVEDELEKQAEELAAETGLPVEVIHGHRARVVAPPEISPERAQEILDGPQPAPLNLPTSDEDAIKATAIKKKRPRPAAVVPEKF